MHAFTSRGDSTRVARSPDTKLRLEAKPDDPTGEEVESRFTYELLDKAKGTRLWSRRQPQDEGPPRRMLVDNRRWVVIWTERDQIALLRPEDGKRTLLLEVVERFSEEEREQYMTGPAPAWSSHVLMYFLRAGDRQLFVLRTWWGRYIVVDAVAASVLADLKNLAETLHEASCAAVMAKLRPAATASQPAGAGQCDSILQYAGPVYLAGLLNLREAVPILRKIESWDQIDTSVRGDPDWADPSWDDSDRGEILREGDVSPFNYGTRTIRRLAQLSLRRLGEKPEGHAATEFYFAAADGTPRERVPVQSPFTSREDRVDRVKEGLKAPEVLKTVGAPDYVVTRLGPGDEPLPLIAWEYDMDTDPPMTLRVVWSEKTYCITRVERIQPALWQAGSTRDADVGGY